MGYSEKMLREELLESNEFFDMLVDMIPSKLYISDNTGDDYNPKYHKVSKEDRKNAAKLSKRRKLDPESAETTTKLKERLEEHKASPRAPTSKVAATPSADNASRIEALRAKLHAKIAEKQGDRPKDPSAVSKRAARRMEKNRRKEEAIKKKANSAVNATKYKITPDANPARDLEHIDFGKLAGFEAASKNYLESNKSLKNLSKTKNLQKLLQDAEAKKQKLQELKRSTNEEDQQKAGSMLWKDVISEADGKRVKDDTKQLKRAIKKKEVAKKKSQKAWKSRLQVQKQHQKNKQSIRNHNLKHRKSGEKLSKKKIVENRPGFEGRKREFLNSPKTQQ